MAAIGTFPLQLETQLADTQRDFDQKYKAYERAFARLFNHFDPAQYNSVGNVFFERENGIGAELKKELRKINQLILKGAHYTLTHPDESQNFTRKVCLYRDSLEKKYVALVVLFLALGIHNIAAFNLPAAEQEAPSAFRSLSAEEAAQIDAAIADQSPHLQEVQFSNGVRLFVNPNFVFNVQLYEEPPSDPPTPFESPQPSPRASEAAANPAAEREIEPQVEQREEPEEIPPPPVPRPPLCQRLTSWVLDFFE